MRAIKNIFYFSSCKFTPPIESHILMVTAISYNRDVRRELLNRKYSDVESKVYSFRNQ